MAKRRKHSSRKRGGGKCPEPFNTLIDIAGAMAMGAVASHMDKKHNYSDRGKINPYSVSALGIASGRIKNTNDLIRTGAMLGALGAFDDDSSDSARRNISEDPVFSTIHYESHSDNRYAWRLNCEDGSEYGIDPEMYETRAEYHAALYEARGYEMAPVEKETFEDVDVTGEDCEDVSEEAVYPPPDFQTFKPQTTETDTSKRVDPFADDDFHVYVYCLVKLPDIDAPVYYRTEDHALKRGDYVTVPHPNGSQNVLGEIITVEHHMRFSVPVPVEETDEIVGDDTVFGK